MTSASEGMDVQCQKEILSYIRKKWDVCEKQNIYFDRDEPLEKTFPYTSYTQVPLYYSTQVCVPSWLQNSTYPKQ